MNWKNSADITDMQEFESQENALTVTRGANLNFPFTLKAHNTVIIAEGCFDFQLLLYQGFISQFNNSTKKLSIFLLTQQWSELKRRGFCGII